MTRVAVILHERVGNWARQLRPRLHDHPVRWFETRSRADLDAALTGLASPVVLIDLGARGSVVLQDLDLILRRASDARVLVLDPEAHEGVPGLARELGATHVLSGFAPPPLVCNLLGRWIELAHRRIACEGWSRTLTPDASTEPWGWLSAYLGDPQEAQGTASFSTPGRVPRRADMRGAPVDSR